MDANATVIERDLRNSELHIAILSTPRSGNNWLRRLLADMYGLVEQSVHNPIDIDWNNLPPRLVLQMHWHRIEPFRSLLEQHNFRVVVLSRHPLDVLISILHFATHEPDTARWLEGEEGDESKIWHASPCSSVFQKYATSTRAATLLNVSREWWQAPGSHWLRYEDLVHDPVATLEQLAQGIDAVVSGETITKSIAANSIEALRPKVHNQHFWRGQPGHWKSLLPATEARHIAQVHRAIFDEFGYACDPDETLDLEQAGTNWNNFRVRKDKGQQKSENLQPLQTTG